MSTGKSPLGKGLAALISDTKAYHNRAKDELRDEAQQKQEYELKSAVSIRANNLTKTASITSPVRPGYSIDTISEVSIANLSPDPDQARQNIDEFQIDELARSIMEHGILQPILVKQMRTNEYQIIAGERRWRGGIKAGLDYVPVIIKNITDAARREISIVENIQRQDLNPMEEATAYNRLIEDFFYTQDILAHKLGKSRSYISNTVRLLNLPAEVKKLIHDRKISQGHARSLINHPDPLKLAHKIVKFNLNVRQVEELIREEGGGKDLLSSQIPLKQKFQDELDDHGTKANLSTPHGEIVQQTRVIDSDILQIEEMLSKSLGLEVQIMDTVDGGAVNIKFEDLEQLDKVIQLLNNHNSKLLD